MSGIGCRIAETRKRLNISQNRLAKMAGIAQATLSRIEAADGTANPSTETLQLLANALCVPLAELIDDDAEKADPDDRADLRRQFLITFDGLSPSAQDEALRYLRFLASQVPPRGE